MPPMLIEQVSNLRKEEAILKEFLASLAMVQESKEDQEGGCDLVADGDDIGHVMEVCVCCIQYRKQGWFLQMAGIIDITFVFRANPVAGNWY